MKKVEINEVKEIKERNDEVCVGNTRLVKVFSYRLTVPKIWRDKNDISITKNTWEDVDTHQAIQRSK